MGLAPRAGGLNTFLSTMRNVPPGHPLPSYDSLPRNEALDGNVAWGVFGADDEVGAVNLLTPERIASAAAEIKRGAFFNLCLPLNEPVPSRRLQRSDGYCHSLIKSSALARVVQQLVGVRGDKGG